MRSHDACVQLGVLPILGYPSPGADLTTSPPWLSLVIPSFNQARYLEMTLAGLTGEVDEEIELIVIDGGSTDGSVDVIRRYEHRLSWWVSEADQGQSDALNKGFSHARGYWFGWINSDDLLLPGALATLAQFLAAHPDAQWVAGGGHFIDASGATLRSYSPPAQPLRSTDLAPWTHTWFGQPGCLFRRDLYLRAGGHVRTDLHYAMDLDLWLRLGQWEPLQPVPAELGAYRLHERSKTMAERAPMEVEVVQVLLEHLGAEAALKRVKVLADDHFSLEARYRRLTSDLVSPAGWWRLLQRRIRHGGSSR